MHPKKLKKLNNMERETMENSNEILFVNVIKPKKGKLEEFAKVQVKDFTTYGTKLDGSTSNEFYVSVNEQGDGHCVNIARFKDLESYYRGTSTATFKDHIKRITPLLESTQPMLLKKVWESGDSEVEYSSQEPEAELLRNQDQGLQKKYNTPAIQPH
jgi:hypothetical protein